MIKQIFYFGSFNPFHNGHLNVINTVAQKFKDSILHICPSGYSPMKDNSLLLPYEQRVEIINKVLELNRASILDECYDRIRVNNIDMNTSPHYTCETLETILTNYKDCEKQEIGLVVGEDQFRQFHLWMNSDWILDNFGIIVYPRNRYQSYDDLQKLVKDNFQDNNIIVLDDVKMMNISSTEIRNVLSEVSTTLSNARNKLLELYDDSNILKLLFNNIYEDNLSSNIILWLDDERNPYDEKWNELIRNNFEKVANNANFNHYKIVWVKNYIDFINYIDMYSLPFIIDFDHDLGNKYFTGMNCMKYLVEHLLENKPKQLPIIYYHTSNIPGRENMESYFNSYLKSLE